MSGNKFLWTRYFDDEKERKFERIEQRQKRKLISSEEQLS
jgi:hypothetical protein